MTDFQSKARRSAVLAAVQRAIFCGTCKAVLDIDRSVLVENVDEGGIAVCCDKCWKRLVERVRALGVKDATDTFEQLEVWHGKGHEIVLDEVVS